MLLLLALACTGTKESTVPPNESKADSQPQESTPDTGTPLDPATVRLDGPCDRAVRYGGFVVDANEDYGYVSGSVLNGVVPITVLTPIAQSGECSLLRKENPFCDPTCEPGYTCDLTNTCVPYPEAQDLGTVTVNGLLTTVIMAPVVPGYSYFNTSVPNPPWELGAAVELVSSGGAFDPIALYGVGPAPLTSSAVTWSIVDGQPLSMSWDAPPSGARSTVHATLQVDQHGATPATVECWFADDGAGEIPADLISSFLAMGISGFPNGVLERTTVDSVALQGAAAQENACVDLELSSSKIASVTVAGYTPCDEPSDCPPGTFCNMEMQRCE